MKAKPIENGCLAMIIFAPAYPEVEGRIVEVIRKVVPSDCKKSELRLVGQWIIDLGIKKRRATSCIRESGLMRVDDPDIQREIESERELEVTK